MVDGRSDDPLPPILGLTDIINRWTFTREGLRKWMKADPNFPEPIGAINSGRNKIWLEEDIARYEKRHPILSVERHLRLTQSAQSYLRSLSRWEDDSG